MRRLACTILAASLLLAGCWDRKEINDIALVMGTSVDKEGNQYKVTVQIAMPSQLGGAGSQGGGGGTSGTKAWHSLTATAETIRKANEIEQQALSRILYFSHRRTLLIGEDLAREGILDIMDVFSRIPQNRLTANVAITQGKSVDIMESEAPIERFPSEAIREQLNQYMKRNRVLKDLITSILQEGIDPAIPFFKTTSKEPGSAEAKGKENIRVGGLAVFKKEKLVGFLEGDDAQGALWAMDEARIPTVSITAPGSKKKIAVQFHQTESKLKPVIQQDGTILMQIRIKAIGSVVDNESRFTPVNMGTLETLVGKKIEGNVKNSLSILQKKYKADIIGFGRNIYMDDPTYWRQISANWDEMYPKVKTEVQTDIQIEHSGALIAPFQREEGNR
ncbi:Ger(x)C family spore germination protein [Brevibacillus fulvus]|uniref:Spore germination protein KC n=1 Tax=Brevibacillus fulvus TaxID=1125967 RepID=A0A938XYB9_9BACL|nr:Ger(x)C family spore germination protein [Brevibacillus fulvus]MBM7590096.1 spore germination protein KC [Brevibacillus fulvus]